MGEADNAARGVQSFLTYRMVRVQARLNAQASRILSRVAGITLPQWRILALVGDGGELSSSDIVARSSMDKGLVSRTLKSLNAAGLVISRTHTGDRRVQEHQLTPEGRSLFRKTLPYMLQRQVMIRSAFSQREMDALEAALRQLEQLAEIDPPDP